MVNSKENNGYFWRKQWSEVKMAKKKKVNVKSQESCDKK
jgi:hypothetical protein